MKFRSALLVALMVIVPGLAMFSHHVPAGLAAAARRLLLAPVLGWTASWRETSGSEATTQAARIEPAAAAEPAPTAPHAITEVDRTKVRDRLREVGGMAVECRQLAGATAGHVASCRVALDADGQLQRVFQATGHDALAAERQLLEDVIAWRERRSRQE